jgi:hypothetical protein
LNLRLIEDPGAAVFVSEQVFSADPPRPNPEVDNLSTWCDQDTIFRSKWQPQAGF